MTKVLVRSRIALAVAGLSLASLAVPASALVVELDSFTVMKNGAMIFQDQFDDGLRPPAASEFVRYLFTQGIGTEAGNVLQLTPSTAPITSNALGNPSQTARAALDTNVDPTNLVHGLKSSAMTFSVTTVYNFVAPAQGENYGVRLADRTSTGALNTNGPAGDDVVDLHVFRNSAGDTAVRLREQDFVANTIETRQSITLSAAMLAGVDQISLTLARNDPNSSVISASFALLDSGMVLSSTSFTATSSIFSNENWTRPEFLASQPAIPEPETYAMMLVGLGLVGLHLRRRARRAATGRFA